MLTGLQLTHQQTFPLIRYAQNKLQNMVMVIIFFQILNLYKKLKSKNSKSQNLNIKTRMKKLITLCPLLCMIIISVHSLAQNNTVNLQVKESNGQPIPAATILIDK